MGLKYRSIGNGGGGGSGLSILANNAFLQGLTTAAVPLNLIGVNTNNNVAIDPTGVGALVGPWSSFALPGTYPPAGTALAFIGAAAANPRFVGIGIGGTPTFDFRRANTSQAAPTAVASGDILASFLGRGWGSTDWGIASARVEMVAAQAWTDAVNGARIRFVTVANGGTTGTVKFIMDENGELVFGATPVNTVPGLIPNGAQLRCRLGDNSAYATFDAGGYRVGGTAGASGTFTTTDLKTVTVTNGIVTSIV